MAGSGLDFRNAALGAVFGSVAGAVSDMLIENLRFVWHCKGECTALREELKKVKPLLEKVLNENKEDPAMKNWMDVFGDCLKKAEEIVEKCTGDRSVMWDRAYEVRYGGEILKLKEEIRNNANLAGLALLSVQGGSGSKSNRGGCWAVQEVPGKILGMDGHFQRAKSLIAAGRKLKERCCVGIRGMGGAGKTLLAKMVNNDEEIQEAFGKESIIWITVGRDAQVSVIYEQMRQRLGIRRNGGSLEDQRTELWNEFSSRSVLLILDDLWDGVVHEHKEMVEWLNIARGRGSVTLVTTRDEPISRKCVNAGEEIILRLSEEQSWELFCSHAFGGDVMQLGKDLEGVAEDVCKECKCLPLALKVIGGAMKGKRDDMREWQRMLQRLRSSSVINSSVDKQLFGRLGVSYEELDSPTKICFLYFAAFPEDCAIPAEHLLRVWVAEGLFGEDLDVGEACDEAQCALNELLGRSLIERCNSGHDGMNMSHVKMHDILRDLAIQISREGKECERESLFEMGGKELEEFPREWLGRDMKVKRLSIWGNKMKRFPDNFEAPSLKTCILYPTPWKVPTWEFKSNVQKCVVEKEFFEKLKGLRFLQVCANKSIHQFPESIGRLKCLQHLNFRWCKALQELPESIGGLGSLQHLNLEGCEALQELPESIGGLGSLENFNLRWCKALQELPESIGRLGSLQYLNLEWCKALQELPRSIGGLQSLQHLNLSWCVALEELPESIGGLGSLHYLNLLGCVALQELPQSIGGLRSLQHLNLKRCVALQKLPKSVGGLGSLEQLNLSWCEALQELPESIGELGSLQYLRLVGCEALQELPQSIKGSVSFQHLKLSW